MERKRNYQTKYPKIGKDYQADVADLPSYDDDPAYANEDKLVWNPDKLYEDEVVDYLRKSHLRKCSRICTKLPVVPPVSCVKDDEEALFLLANCQYDKEEALRRQNLDCLPRTGIMSLWSEDECRDFEDGLKMYGKQFHLIQMNKVRTKAICDLVEFYYFWKKTERGAEFLKRFKKKKKLL